MRTQDKAKSKAREFGPGLAEVYSVATKLAAALGPAAIGWEQGPIEPLEPDQVVIVFSDGLPNVAMEEIEEETMMVDAGLQSRVRALQRLHGLDQASAAALAEEIAEEKKARAPASPVSPGGAGLGAVLRQQVMAEGVEEQDEAEMGE